MKKLVLFVLVSFLFIGCTTTEVLRNIDIIHDSVKSIITSPSVHKQLPVDTLLTLEKIDKRYLAAEERLRSGWTKNPSAVEVIVECAEDFLLVIDDLALDSKHKKKIQIIGSSLRTLKDYLKEVRVS
jgi:hypothetical protein